MVRGLLTRAEWRRGQGDPRVEGDERSLEVAPHACKRRARGSGSAGVPRAQFFRLPQATRLLPVDRLQLAPAHGLRGGRVLLPQLDVVDRVRGGTGRIPDVDAPERLAAPNSEELLERLVRRRAAHIDLRDRLVRLVIGRDVPAAGREALEARELEAHAGVVG